VDIHCVTRWSKLGTQWRGVSVDTLLDQVAADAPYVLAFCDGGYTTNLPAEDVTGGKACVAFGYDGRPLEAEHGGPARLLVPPDWQVPVVRCGELVDRRLRAPGIGGVWLDGGRVVQHRGGDFPQPFHCGGLGEQGLVAVHGIQQEPLVALPGRGRRGTSRRSRRSARRRRVSSWRRVFWPGS